MKTLQSKLLEFQSLVNAVKKDSINPFFKSNYADINAYLDVIKPILTQVGLVLLQPLTTVDGKPAIKTILLSEEERLEETIIIPENPDPQKMGATITYFRRYALQSLLALQAEDDDANSVSQRPAYQPSETANPAIQNTVDNLKNYNIKDEQQKPWINDQQFNDAIKTMVDNGTIKFGVDPREVMKLLRLKYAVAKKYEALVSDKIAEHAMGVINVDEIPM